MGKRKRGGKCTPVLQALSLLLCLLNNRSGKGKSYSVLWRDVLTAGARREA